MNEIFDLINRILFHFAGDSFRDDLLKAKATFFDKAGVLDETLPNYELRMSQFFDWYFFTRHLSGYAAPPVQVTHMARELRLSNEDLKWIEALKQCRHSLFQFRKIKGDDLYVKDLFKNEKITLKNSPWIFGFNEEEIFEARIVPYQDSYLMTKGICFHPPAATRFIMSEIKRHKKDPDLNADEMMLALLKMRYRLERYSHVDPEKIYTHESQVKT